MDKRVIFICLTLALMLFAAACTGVDQTELPAEPAMTEAPAEPAMTEAPAEPAMTEAPAEPANTLDFMSPEKPLLPYYLKPRLEFINGADSLEDQVVGFTFPNGTIALKAAPIKDIYSYPYGDDPSGLYTPVGLVEIGPDSDTGVQPGPYQVLLDLQSIDQSVPGEIRFLYDDGVRYSFYFQRVPQSLNELRFNPNKTSYPEFIDISSPPDSSVTITSDGVCFILRTGNPSQGEDYIRYCSEPGSVLSPQENYKNSLYEGLIGDIGRTAAIFGMEQNIQYDQIVSEMEDLEHISLCAEKNLAGDLEGAQQECGSDITVAPVTEDYFWGRYDEGYGRMKSQSFIGYPIPLASILPAGFMQEDIFAGHFPVPVAAIQVLNPIDTDPDRRFGDDRYIVQPGDYLLEYWFDVNEEFYAATISGIRYADDFAVNLQPVPAVPATFVNADGSDQASTQISTCRIFRRCVFWQQICP